MRPEPAGLAVAAASASPAARSESRFRFRVSWRRACFTSDAIALPMFAIALPTYAADVWSATAFTTMRVVLSAQSINFA